MKKLFLLLFSILCIGILAYANDQEYYTYRFITSCGKTAEITLTGEISEDLQQQWLEAFEEMLCTPENDLGDKEDVLP